MFSASSMRNPSAKRCLHFPLIIALSLFAASSASSAISPHQTRNLISYPFKENHETTQRPADRRDSGLLLIRNEDPASKNHELARLLVSPFRSRLGLGTYSRHRVRQVSINDHRRIISAGRQVDNRTKVIGSRSAYTITYAGNPPAAARKAFEYAVGMWADNFECSVVLRIRFKWQNMRGRTVAASNSPFVIVGRNSSSTLLSDTAYTPTLAAAVSGHDFLLSKPHMEIIFNSRQPWHYNLNISAPSDLFDFGTIALHELCHALFFSGALLGRTITKRASFVSVKMKPSRFDQFIQTRASVGIARSCNASELFRAITTPGLSFRSTADNSSFALYAPPMYSAGMSTYHFDPDQLPWDCAAAEIPQSECSDLMRPDLHRGFTQRTIGEPVLRVMRTLLGLDDGLRRSEKCKYVI